MCPDIQFTVTSVTSVSCTNNGDNKFTKIVKTSNTIGARLHRKLKVKFILLF